MAATPNDGEVLDVIVRVPSYDATLNLLHRDDLDFGCRPRLWREPHGRFSIAAIADERTLTTLREAGYDIEVVGNATERWRRCLELVIRHDSKSTPALPHGAGRYGANLKGTS